jgi:peptide/nickel transport system substrate-binding protein
MREPVERGGWSVMNTVPACYDMINPATNRFLRTGGLTGSAPSWPTDEEIEALRGAWFAATDDARRRDLADQIGQRAFEFVPYIPTGQLVGRQAFRKNLAVCSTRGSHSCGTSKNSDMSIAVGFSVPATNR